MFFPSSLSQTAVIPLCHQRKGTKFCLIVQVLGELLHLYEIVHKCDKDAFLLYQIPINYEKNIVIKMTKVFVHIV